MMKLGKVSVETRGVKFICPEESDGSLETFG